MCSGISSPIEFCTAVALLFHLTQDRDRQPCLFCSVHCVLVQYLTAFADFLIGLVDGQHNCLLIYLHRVSATSTLVSLHLHNDSVKCHILWVWIPGVGPMTPQKSPNLTLARFFAMHLTTKFHHPMFSCSEVIMLINKHTQKQSNAAENIYLASLCYSSW